MKEVLAVGSYNKSGAFYSDNWKQFIDWIRNVSDKVDIIADIDKASIILRFGLENIMEQYIFPDMDNYSVYTIRCNQELFNVLQHWNYNINKPNISHIYFYSDNREVAYIEINDNENYIVLELTATEKQELLSCINSIETNIVPKH